MQASTPKPSIPIWERLYMPVAMLLTLFGVIAMFSIGLPFVILGLGMMLLWPLRRERERFLSLFIGLFVFVVVGVLVAPGGCTTTSTLSGTGGRTTCDNLLGIDYSGGTGYTPPLWPAVATGILAGALSAAAAFAFLRRGRNK